MARETILNSSVVSFLVGHLDVLLHHNAKSLAQFPLFLQPEVLPTVHAFAQRHSVRPLHCWFSTVRLYNSSVGADFDVPHRDEYAAEADPSGNVDNAMNELSIVLQLTAGRHLFILPRSWSAHTRLACHTACLQPCPAIGGRLTVGTLIETCGGCTTTRFDWIPECRPTSPSWPASSRPTQLELQPGEAVLFQGSALWHGVMPVEQGHTRWSLLAFYRVRLEWDRHAEGARK